MATYNMNVTCLCDNPVEFHCNTCGDALCSNCKKTHLKSKATGHHSVVPYTDRIMPMNISSLLCATHAGKECTFWCSKCEHAVCTKCATSTHQGHALIEIETILKVKRSSIQQKLGNLESNVVKDWGKQPSRGSTGDSSVLTGDRGS